ncbi:MAG TPA: bifunctional phosphopantothenoylcysteine decarboxylase/phosphopantothenate--cysteine ligase CoaBC, partial [Chitinophagales bacterium]|nr:bifunctional phosphopantothenoylcysteine decarboxylase/phosphopantothenate--cysteine ligase CoaBC [Chitinophagales bacterium]
MLKDKKIVLAVCGSIAAYKAAFLVRLLIKQGASVKVIMTKAATEFISPLTLATLSKNECNVDYINADKTNWNNHVELALWADLMLIAPLSAGTLAKLANGICDNLLMAVYLSARCPIYLAPAMDEDMWKHPSTQNNLQKVQSYSNKVITVNSGELASGLIGEGRMAEPEEIIAFIEHEIGNNAIRKKFIGKKVLVTAGPTYEALDPVRFIGNHSSGKMGIAIATLLHNLGATVHLVLGPSKLAVPSAIKVSHVFSA